MYKATQYQNPNTGLRTYNGMDQRIRPVPSQQEVNQDPALAYYNSYQQQKAMNDTTQRAVDGFNWYKERNFNPAAYDGISGKDGYYSFGSPARDSAGKLLSDKAAAQQFSNSYGNWLSGYPNIDSNAIDVKLLSQPSNVGTLSNAVAQGTEVANGMANTANAVNGLANTANTVSNIANVAGNTANAVGATGTTLGTAGATAGTALGSTGAALGTEAATTGAASAGGAGLAAAAPWALGVFGAGKLFGWW